MKVVAKLEVAPTDWPLTVRPNVPSAASVVALRSRLKTPGVMLVTVLSSSKLTVVSAAATSTTEGVFLVGIPPYSPYILRFSPSDGTMVTQNDHTGFAHSDIKTGSNKITVAVTSPRDGVHFMLCYLVSTLLPQADKKYELFPPKVRISQVSPHSCLTVSLL